MNLKVQKKQWFQQALKSQQGPLIRYTMRITWNEQESLDVVQESFLKLWGQPYPEAVNWIPPWLFRVCRNHALDLKRRNKNREFWDDELDLPSSLLGPHENLQLKEMLTYLKSLKGETQEILLLKFGEGLTYKEIAEVTGLKPNYVGVLIHQGVKELRNLAKKGEEENE